jgi:undecaprenyl-diphosphatase
LTNGVKDAVDRPRPHFATAVGHWSGASFPSGHTSGAISIYLPLAVIATATLRARGARVAVVVTALAITIAVAASRVLLGAHYLSDVIAGGVLGGAVLALCWATAQQGSRVTGE